jgi:predicted phage tail protein
MSLKTIRLYGPLGEQFGRVWRLDVKSPAEAIRALCSQLPGFRQYLQQNSAPGYRVLADTQGRDDSTLALPTGAGTIRVVPVVCGAGKGLGQIFLGAALIGASFFLPTTPLISGFQFSLSSIAFGVGANLALGGIAQALTKAPNTQNASVERAENKPSYAFDGAVNTAAQGNPVPVCYGEMIVGSQVISAGMVAEQVAA